MRKANWKNHLGCGSELEQDLGGVAFQIKFNGSGIISCADQNNWYNRRHTICIFTISSPYISIAYPQVWMWLGVVIIWVPLTEIGW